MEKPVEKPVESNVECVDAKEESKESKTEFEMTPPRKELVETLHIEHTEHIEHKEDKERKENTIEIIEQTVHVEHLEHLEPKEPFAISAEPVNSMLEAKGGDHVGQMGVSMMENPENGEPNPRGWMICRINEWNPN